MSLLSWNITKAFLAAYRIAGNQSTISLKRTLHGVQSCPISQHDAVQQDVWQPSMIHGELVGDAQRERHFESSKLLLHVYNTDTNCPVELILSNLLNSDRWLVN